MESVDIVIVGGGFTGLAAAVALARLSLRTIVLEANPGPDLRFRGELIHPPGVDVLERLGLLAELQRDGGSAFRGFAVSRAPEEIPSVLPYSEIPGGRSAGLVMDHSRMVANMRRQLSTRRGVDLRMGQRVASLIREDGQIAGVRTSDGEEFRARITLVAEGRHSRLRRLLGFEERSRLLSLTAALLVKDLDLSDSEYGRIYLGAPGPILVYKVGGAVRMCIDVPLAPDRAGNNHQAVALRIKSEYAPLLPPQLREPLEAAMDAGPLDMCGTHEIRTTRCVLPGVALVGDAGGCSHPLAASGMLIGLNDVDALEAAIRMHGPMAPALEAYQRRRYRFARAREIVADALYEVFRAADDGSRAIRGGVFRYWQAGMEERATSMALLCGYDSRFKTFLYEYLRVLRFTLPGILSPRVPLGLHGRFQSVQGVMRTSYRYLDRAAASLVDGTLR